MLFKIHVTHDKFIQSNQHLQYPKKYNKQAETWKQFKIEGDRIFKDQKIQKLR